MIARSEAPRLFADATSLGSTAPTPCTVFNKIGNKAPMNVIKIMEASDEGKIRIAKGIHATAGIGRNTSNGGIRKAASF